MRETKKLINGDYVIDTYVSLNEPFKTPINKLGQLEDIEEELGIDLATLFKALKNGIYEKFEDGEYVKFNGLCMPIKSHKLKLNVNKKCLERGNDYFYFKDYGKTWALTREELL